MVAVLENHVCGTISVSGWNSGTATSTQNPSYDYQAFGETYAATTSETIDNRYQYTSREKSSVTGLMFYRYRIYLPKLGRFNRNDLVRIFGQPNLYLYVMDSPIRFSDSFGLDPEMNEESFNLLEKVREHLRNKFSDPDSSEQETTAAGNAHGLTSGVQANFLLTQVLNALIDVELSLIGKMDDKLKKALDAIKLVDTFIEEGTEAALEEAITKAFENKYGDTPEGDIALKIKKQSEELYDKFLSKFKTEFFYEKWGTLDEGCESTVSFSWSKRHGTFAYVYRKECECCSGKYKYKYMNVTLVGRYPVFGPNKGKFIVDSEKYVVQKCPRK